jgi:hypothetical protein
MKRGSFSSLLLGLRHSMPDRRVLAIGEVADGDLGAEAAQILAAGSGPQGISVTWRPIAPTAPAAPVNRMGHQVLKGWSWLVLGKVR